MRNERAQSTTEGLCFRHLVTYAATTLLENTKMTNVFGFGAVGDGVADDPDALQHALNDGNGVLRLNKGLIASPNRWSSTRSSEDSVRWVVKQRLREQRYSLLCPRQRVVPGGCLFPVPRRTMLLPPDDSHSAMPNSIVFNLLTRPRNGSILGPPPRYIRPIVLVRNAIQLARNPARIFSPNTTLISYTYLCRGLPAPAISTRIFPRKRTKGSCT
jgi:hypothetical protein